VFVIIVSACIEIENMFLSVSLVNHFVFVLFVSHFGLKSVFCWSMSIKLQAKKTLGAYLQFLYIQ